MVCRSGPLYGVVLVIIAGYALGLDPMLASWSCGCLLKSPSPCLRVLSVFSFLGGALYERRHELGLETWASPERTDERRRARNCAS